MDLTWERYLGSVPAVTDSALDSAATMASVQLPIAYRDLVKAHAGECPEPSVVPLGDNGKNAVWGPLLVPDAGENRTARTYVIPNIIRDLHENGWQQLFPIASDTANGLFCLDGRSGGEASAVVFIDLTYGPDEVGALRPIATSLAEALTKLR